MVANRTFVLSLIVSLYSLQVPLGSSLIFASYYRLDLPPFTAMPFLCVISYPAHVFCVTIDTTIDSAYTWKSFPTSILTSNLGTRDGNVSTACTNLIVWSAYVFWKWWHFMHRQDPQAPLGLEMEMVALQASCDPEPTHVSPKRKFTMLSTHVKEMVALQTSLL